MFQSFLVVLRDIVIQGSNAFGPCTGDYLKIYEGIRGTRRLVRDLCNVYHAPLTIRSYGNPMHLEFFTRNPGTSSFRGEYRLLRRNPPPRRPPITTTTTTQRPLPQSEFVSCTFLKGKKSYFCKSPFITVHTKCRYWRWGAFR